MVPRPKIRSFVVFTFVFALGFASNSSRAEGQPLHRYKLDRVMEVDGRQGVATDGQHYFVSGSTSLHIYSKTGNLLKTNDDPFAKLAKPANHLGDISVHNGELYAGIEWFVDGRGKDIQIAIYDAKTLDFKRSFAWEPDSGQVEVSALAVDAPRGLVWMTDWVKGNYVYRYDLQTGRYLGKIHLRAVPQWQQGIAVFDGSIFITADDGDADHKEHDNLWRFKPTGDSSAAFIHHELELDAFRDVGEIEGITFDDGAKEMLILSNRGKRIQLGMPKGFYPGYDREIHEIYIFRILSDDN